MKLKITFHLSPNMKFSPEPKFGSKVAILFLSFVYKTNFIAIYKYDFR